MIPIHKNQFRVILNTYINIEGYENNPGINNVLYTPHLRWLLRGILLLIYFSNNNEHDTALATSSTFPSLWFSIQKADWQPSEWNRMPNSPLSFIGWDHPVSSITAARPHLPAFPFISRIKILAVEDRQICCIPPVKLTNFSWDLPGHLYWQRNVAH